MGKEQITVLHIDSEKEWRGGQQQAAYLLEAMHKNEFQTAIVCQPLSKMEAFCLQHALPYFSIKMRGEIDFIAGFRIAKLCRKYNFKILCLHSAHALSIGLWTKFFYRKLKIIAVRRVDFFIKKNWFSQFKYKNRLIDKIVCVSNAITNVLIEGGVSRNKLITIHSGIDIHKFDNIKADKNFKTKIGIPENHIIVGTIAAMAGHKDYPNLLKAAEIVLQKHSNVTFCAVGDGPEKEKIRQMAQKLNLGKKFIFTGFQKNIGQYLKIFDIFVLASKQEGLGTSILDAQSVGLPVIACETGGIPEAVFNKKNGLLVPPKNEQSLAEAILKLINDSKSRNKFGKIALKTVKNFDINLTVQKNIELYERIILLP